MTAPEILMDLDRMGVHLETRDGKLLYSPRSKVPAELATRMLVHKHDLLAILTGEPAVPVCRCGSDRYIDVPIQDGQSTRRDCARCGRFLSFPIWYESTNEGEK